MHVTSSNISRIRPPSRPFSIHAVYRNGSSTRGSYRELQLTKLNGGSRVSGVNGSICELNTGTTSQLDGERSVPEVHSAQNERWGLVHGAYGPPNFNSWHSYCLKHLRTRDSKSGGQFSFYHEGFNRKITGDRQGFSYVLTNNFFQVMKLVKNFGSTPASSPCGGCIGVCKAFPPANRGSHGYVLRFGLEEEDEVEGEEEEEEREGKWEGMVGNLKGGRKKKKMERKREREGRRRRMEEEEWRKKKKKKKKKKKFTLEGGRRELGSGGRPWSRIPELDFEIPPEAQRGTLSTVEGILKRAADELEVLQEERRKVDPGTAEAIDKFLINLRSFAEGSASFSFILDDPAGNSFIENPYAPMQDPSLSIKFYERTPEQQATLGFLAETSEEIERHSESNSPTDEKRLPGIGVQEFSHGSVGAIANRHAIAQVNSDQDAEALYRYSAPEEVETLPSTCGACGAPCVIHFYATSILSADMANCCCLILGHGLLL
ncbi:hypothetical protein M5K25_016176 [Dendrobium thyrsiflorum]|uniref:Zinc finger ZPR1-type domain-containing protein n=1 Tax=Dendrobium thyrsiflorum TaxID=117978 RepID=A0ABD0UJG3_DENTH